MTEDEQQFAFPEPNEDLKRPSAGYIAKVLGDSNATLETDDPAVLEMYYWGERASNWLRANATPINLTIEELTERWRDDLDTLLPLPTLSVGTQDIYDRYEPIRIGSDTWTLEGHKAFWDEMEQRVHSKDPLWYEFHNMLDIEQKRDNQIRQWAWEREHLLTWNWVLFTVSEDPPDWVLQKSGLSGAPTTATERNNTASALRLARPIISPAFKHDGREGLGRISSDEVTFGLYDALIAPKGEWVETAKGWPIFRPTPGSDRISIRVAPIVENRNKIDAQRAEMWNIVRELGVREFDVIAIMMAQVLTDGRSDGRAILPADTILDYRGVGQRTDEDGYSEGRQPKLRASISESVYRIAHLRVTTDALPILEYDRKGNPTLSTIDFNEPVVELHSNYSRRRDDKTLLWEYSLGRWFTTYRQKPHAYTAYMLQRALGYNPKTQQWAKQLAYYLALELRRNADNGQELSRPISWFIDGARIPCEQRYAQKGRDRFEDGMRQITKDGLIRIVQGDTIIDKSSSGADSWAPAGANTLKGRDWLGAYRKLTVSIRCDEDTEHRYDREIRKRRALAEERNKKRTARGKGSAR